MNQLTGIVLISVAIGLIAYTGFSHEIETHRLREQLEQQKRDHLNYRLGVRDGN